MATGAKPTPPPGRARSRATSRRPPPVRTRGRTAGIAAAVAIGAGLAFVGVNALTHRGEVMPGVSVGGVSLAGLDRAAAEQKLTDVWTKRLVTPVELDFGARVVKAKPSQLGFEVDARTSVAPSVRGRPDARPAPRPGDTAGHRARHPADVARPAGHGAPAACPQAARRAPIVTPAGTVRLQKSRVGARFEPRQVVDSVSAALVAGANRAVIEPVAIKPAVDDAAVRPVITTARKMLAGPIKIVLARKTLGKLTPAELAPMLVFTRPKGGDWRVGIDPAKVRAGLARDVSKIERRAVDARLSTRGDRVLTIPERRGRRLDNRISARAIRRAALTRGRRAQVALRVVKPEVTAADLGKLGIRQKVMSISTDLGDSSANRRHNIRLLARLLDGTVVKPNAEFSFNEAVGPRTVERGFKEGKAIVGGLYVPSIGGGVCQAATTVYDAVFYAGLPITSRRNHDFYISHYAMGMDATVADGGLDLRFKNDTRHGILIRASVQESTMTVDLFSTKRNVTVEKIVSEPYSRRAAAKRYILDPRITGTEARAYSSGTGGFSVDVERVIKRAGTETSRQTFTSEYRPEPQTYLVGPKFKAPKGVAVEDAPAGFLDA